MLFFFLFIFIFFPTLDLSFCNLFESSIQTAISVSLKAVNGRTVLSNQTCFFLLVHLFSFLLQIIGNFFYSNSKVVFPWILSETPMLTSYSYHF